LQSKRNLQLRGCPEDGTRTRRNSAWPDLLLRRVESHGGFFLSVFLACINRKRQSRHLSPTLGINTSFQFN
jgi:hypothetical protein